MKEQTEVQKEAEAAAEARYPMPEGVEFELRAYSYSLSKAFKAGYIAGHSAGEGKEQDGLKDALDKLTDEQRYELFGNYCRHCGCKDPMCACWNNE